MDTSLFQSKSRLDMLKNRTKRCVCKYCGGKLTLRQIFFSEIDEARIEIFCKDCNRIEFGVEPEIYKSACFFVEQTDFNYFQNMDNTDAIAQMNIAKVSELMSWICQNIGILNDTGFTIDLDINENFIGECIVLKDSDFENFPNKGE